MNPVGILKNEHEKIILMLNVLDKMRGQFREGARVDKEHLQNMLRFFDIYYRQNHHNKEELILFPAFLSHTNPKRTGPIVEIMQNHHEEGNLYYSRFKYHVQKYCEDSDIWLPTLIDDFQTFAAFLRKHILEEEKVLFPIINSHISPDMQKRLSQEFVKYELEQVGIEKLNELEYLAMGIAEYYLKLDLHKSVPKSVLAGSCPC